MAFPQLCPKPFDGSNTQDIDYFLSKFEKYASFCQWNDRKRSRALQSMMSDNAARWLQRQEVDEDTPYDAVITLLRERYSITEAQRFQLRTELSAIAQKDQETVDEFADRTEQMCNQLNLDDASKIHHFVTGLQPSVRHHVMRTQPTTMETAINAARAEEGVQRSKSSDKTEASLTMLVKRLVSQLEATSLSSDTPVIRPITSAKEKCQLCQGSDHTAPSCRSHTVCQLCASPQHLAPQCPSMCIPQQYQQRPPARRQNIDIQQVQCFHCSQYGHFRRDCPQRSYGPRPSRSDTRYQYSHQQYGAQTPQSTPNTQHQGNPHGPTRQ